MFGSSAREEAAARLARETQASEQSVADSMNDHDRSTVKNNVLDQREPDGRVVTRPKRRVITNVRPAQQ